MYSRILVPVDGSAASLKGLGEAVKLAKATGATLRVVHVVNELVLDAGYFPANHYEQLIASLREQGKQVLAQAVGAVREQGMNAESDLVETLGGTAATSILEAAKAWGTELIVMGTHGRRGLLRLAMGSDAEMVLRSSPVPVLLVRADPVG